MSDWKISQDYPAVIHAQEGCVVVRNGQEIEFFAGRKDAGAFTLHTFGCKTYGPEAEALGIKLESIRSRGPKAGDAVTYRGGGKYNYILNPDYPSYPPKTEKFGILDHSYGRDSFGICFGASAFRDGSHVSCSGGPIPRVQTSSLTFLGFRRTMFWRWHAGYAGGGEGGNYWIHVPHWLWDGEKSPIN